jgi:hypothetical protein
VIVSDLVTILFFMSFGLMSPPLFLDFSFMSLYFRNFITNAN